MGEETLPPEATAGRCTPGAEPPVSPGLGQPQNVLWVESPQSAGVGRALTGQQAMSSLPTPTLPSLLWAGHHAVTSAHSPAPHAAPVLLTCLSLLSPLNRAYGGGGTGKGGLRLCWGSPWKQQPWPIRGPAAPSAAGSLVSEASCSLQADSCLTGPRSPSRGREGKKGGTTLGEEA